MELIGHYDSPFVRSAAVARGLFGNPHENQAWSAFADADKIARQNALRPVPVLVLDNRQSTIESDAIIDHVEAMFDGSVMAGRSGAYTDAFDFYRWPALERRWATCESLPAFRAADMVFFVSV